MNAILAEKETVRKLPEKAFARRLEIACEGNPHCPTDQYRGKQKWVYDNLAEQFEINVSPEAVRKWFAGETRPRRAAMSALARLLEVDEAWLTLGVKPDLTPVEQRIRNAETTGAANLLAGLIQMNGGNIAYPEGESTVSMFAIIKGRQYQVEAILAFDLGGGRLRFTPSIEHGRHMVIGVVPTANPLHFRLIHLTSALIEAHGERKGDFIELVVKHRGDAFTAGRAHVAEIVDLRDPRAMLEAA